MSSLAPRKEAREVAMEKERGKGNERETVETQREGEEREYSRDATDPHPGVSKKREIDINMLSRLHPLSACYLCANYSQRCGSLGQRLKSLSVTSHITCAE